MLKREPAITPASFASFGALLRYLRQRARLSRADLARAASCSESQIARLELDQRRPDASVVRARFVPALGLDTEPAWVDRLIALAKPTATNREMAAPATNPATLAIPLLTTKLYVPPPRLNLVARSRLIARLQAGLRNKLTLLAAPAGFGKTTLLSAWLSSEFQVPSGRLSSELTETQQLKTSVAWVSLDVGDNDPPRFWSYVCAALETLLPGVAETALALLQSPQPPPAETLLPSLLNAVSARATDCVLVLDDYHVIETAAIHDALTFLLEHVPPTLHLVIASRADPPLPLPRLRARGELTELRAADLRFMPTEAASFLTEVMGLPLSVDDVAVLERRTEGWIAGLQLAALAMRERHDLTSFISAFTGSQRFVGEYLAEEVFNRQPRHIQAFLLQTSILSRMCASLCDAVLNDGAGGAAVQMPYSAVSGESFCQDVLEELERANLFVVPLDDARQWYRYHHLFGEMLCARLVRGGSEAALATLHRRASAWYAGQGLVVEAVQHALAAQEWGTAARLIKQHGSLLSMSGQVHTVLGWLEALPPGIVQQSPTLCQVHAVGLAFTNKFAAAEVRLHDAEHALTPDTPADRARHARGSMSVIRGAIRYFTGDLAQAISLMQQALELLPEPPAPMSTGAGIARARAVAALYAATAYQLTGDVTEVSERRVTAAIAPAQATGYLTEMLTSYSYLASLQVLQGRLRTAAATYTEIERLVPGLDALHALDSSPAYYFGIGDLRREWNGLDAAEGYLVRGMALVQGGLATHASVIVRGYTALAQVQQAQGHSEAALMTLEAFIWLAQERKFFPLLIERAMALRARLQLLQGDLPAALHWAEASGLALADEISFPREAAHLTLARVRIAAGQATEVMPILARLLADAESKARMHSAIEIRVLQALAYDALNNRPRALAALKGAMALAEPEGYVRTFVDEGAPMAALLQEVHTLNRIPNYVKKLLTAFPEQTRRHGEGDGQSIQSVRLRVSQSLVEPLSEREREVLHLIAAGLSNQEIAAQLIVGVSTVKKHINNIFGKLAVRSRTQALAQARELNLL